MNIPNYYLLLVCAVVSREVLSQQHDLTVEEDKTSNDSNSPVHDAPSNSYSFQETNTEQPEQTAEDYAESSKDPSQVTDYEDNTYDPFEYQDVIETMDEPIKYENISDLREKLGLPPATRQYSPQTTSEPAQVSNSEPTETEPDYAYYEDGTNFGDPGTTSPTRPFESREFQTISKPQETSSAETEPTATIIPQITRTVMAQRSYEITENESTSSSPIATNAQISNSLRNDEDYATDDEKWDFDKFMDKIISEVDTGLSQNEEVHASAMRKSMEVSAIVMFLVALVMGF